MNDMKNSVAKIIKMIIAMFSNLNGSSFVGIREYKNSKNQIADHVVIANFSYGNAVEKDLKALKGATDEDIMAIASKGFTPELVRTAIAKLRDAFIKNQNPETASAGSVAQSDAYVPITNSIKLHLESGKIFIYALEVHKHIIAEGEYKPVNSKELTLCQNAVKKHFNFSTAKYRSFEVNKEQLCGVNIDGEKFSLV